MFFPIFLSRKDYDETYLAGHAMALYIDGTETSSLALSFIMYELARHPECQQKMHNEITAVLSKHGDQITYESLHEMQYMETIIHEALRLHPPAFSLAKVCTSPYTLPMTSGQTKPVTIAPGTVVQVPILGVHM